MEQVEEKRFEIVIDAGKPYSVFVDTDQQVIIKLTEIFLAYRGNDSYDVKVYDKGQDMTESQWIEEVVADLLEMDSEGLLGGD